MTSRRSDILALLLLAVGYAITRLPYLYTAGFPDGDQTHTAVGLLDAVQSGAGFLGARIYALAVSPGYYAALFCFSPLYAHHPTSLIPLMSALGALAGLGAQIFLWLAVCRSWGRSAAWLVSLLWMFAPGWWEVTTFGHPGVFAVCAVLAAVFVMVRGTGALSLIAASACFALAVLFRADAILAGAVFPAIAWLRSKSLRMSLTALAVPVVAFAVWAGVLALIHPPTPPGQAGVLERFLAVAQYSPSIYVKELVILVLGLGPVTAALAAMAWLACLVRRRFDALVIALALGLPALLWWIHVEGPFRHLLIVALGLVLPVAALAERRSVFFAVSLGLAVTLANLVTMHAGRGRLLASYSWTYRAAPGVPRWSTRAPLDDWFSSHAAATRAVHHEAAWASALARSPADSVLVITPLPFRYEFAILERGEPHTYRGRLDSTAIWIDLVSGGKAYRFLEGDPGPSQAVLERAAAAGELRGFSYWIPPDAVPTSNFVIPAGMAEAQFEGKP